MITQNGIKLVESFEGFSEMPYLCPAGKLTIGYGHVIKENESFPAGISKEVAEMILYDDLAIAEEAIFKNVNVDLLPHQFDALTSFIFNVGVNAFKTSTLLKKLNAYEFGEVPAQFRRWVYVGKKVNKGLVKRRNKEAIIFEYGYEPN